MGLHLEAKDTCRSSLLHMHVAIGRVTREKSSHHHQILYVLQAKYIYAEHMFLQKVSFRFIITFQ